MKLHAPIKATLAVQATVHATNQREKIRKSIIGLNSDIVAEDTPLIFVLLYPLWTDFDTNYEVAQDVLSSRETRSGRKQVKNLWYGQPSNFNNFKTLHKTLYNTCQS